MSNTEKKLDALIDALGFDAGVRHDRCNPVDADLFLPDGFSYKANYNLTPRSESIFRNKCHAALLAKVLLVAREVYRLNLADLEDCDRFSEDEIKQLRGLA